MILRNYTPFSPLALRHRDVRDREFEVVVLRGAFRIVPGDVATLEPAQPKVSVSDVFHGEPGASSLRAESDMATWKPRSDVLVHAVAHAPSGLLAPSWLARVRVGLLDKTLRVTGPRRWVKGGDGGFQLTEPEACTEVPLQYEYAFGGTHEGWEGRRPCKQNPLGKGYLPEGAEPPDEGLAAPQIESPDDPVEHLGKSYRPEGLGPIASSWEPRSARMGTLDEAWRQERCPKLPLDFDAAYYNSAHPDMVYPGYLRGDEEVLLSGMSPDGDVSFRLPGHRPWLLLRFAKGPLVPMPALLDTLFLDVPEGRAHLTWRSTFRAPAPIRVIEARMARAS